MKFRINPTFEGIQSLLIDIERGKENIQETLYNQRNLVFITTHNNKRYVIKSFKVPHILNRLIYRHIRTSKAERSYLNSLRLGAKLCPTPVAYMEISDHLFLGKSYYIAEMFELSHTMQHILSNKKIKNRIRILRDFADFTFLLHKRGILHKDYSRGNVLVKLRKANKGANEFRIIDNNRMIFRELDIKDRLRNLSRMEIDDEDLQIISDQYSKNAKLDPIKTLNQLTYYRDKFVKKRRLFNWIRNTVR